MRIALATPVAFPSTQGNAVTVERLSRGLRARGVEVDVLDLSRVAAGEVEARLAALHPEAVHAFHAFRGAPAVRAYARVRGIPLAVSLTGTDVNIDLVHEDRRADTTASIREARALVVFHESIRAKVAREVPEAASRIEIIPQSVVLDDPPGDPPGLPARVSGEVRLLLPAGIRRVKNVRFPLAPLGRLARRHPIRFLVAGPIIEADEGARFLRALDGVGWATYLGEVPHERMAALLDRVDVVVNTSFSEGGMANSVLEAMSRGRAVLASDIEGNRSVIEPEVDGLLFADAAGFERQAERLVGDAGLRRRLGAAACGKIARLYSPEREIEAYLALYRRLLAA